MNQPIPVTKKIAPYLAFYLIYSAKVGIGILGFQRIIAKEAGYDGWISVIIAGICVHVILYMMLKMLQTVDGDLLSIHTFIFGKIIGKFLTTFFIIYIGLLTVSTLRGYIEVVQTWMFLELKTFPFAAVIFILCIYIVFGGMKTVAGIAFFSVILTVYTIFLYFFTFPYVNISNLYPIFDHSVLEILKGSKAMTYSLLGFESLLVFYPFINDPNKSKRWAHLAIFAVILLYLYLAIITFVYFPEAQLDKNIWPSLTMWKIIQFPFVERFEYIGIATCCLVILSNIAIFLWCGSRLAKRIFSVRQKTALFILSFLCLIGTSMLKNRGEINTYIDLIAQIGFYFNFVYIPILFIITILKKKVRSR